MRSLWGRVAGLVVLTGLVVVPTVVPSPALAATGTARPTSIALGPDGTSYLAYASGDALSRVDRLGRERAPVPLDRPGPVSGLAVDGSDRIWVAHDDAVSVLEPSGRVVRTLPRTPGATCPHDAAHRVSRYGGLEVTATTYYVADRCTATLEVYDRAAGTLRSRVPLAARAKGLTVRAPGGGPARLFVTVPDRGVVQVFAARSLGARSRPSRTVVLPRPRGGRAPVPSGVVVDRLGIVAVTDAANHAVYLYDSRRGYRMYRTLGHPARPGSSDGSLHTPTGIAQYPQDGSGYSGNLVLADMRNGRVQRWDVGGGYTFWSRTLAPPRTSTPGDPDPGGPGPGEPEGPVGTASPVISRDGAFLLCSPGTWAGGTASFGYEWLRDGTRVASAGGSQYALSPADDGTELVCRVTATTAHGSTTASSDPWFVGTASAPVATAAPRIVGTPARGRTLTCASGTWAATPAPRYSYVWLRGTVQVDDAPAHVVGAGDVGASLTCTVIATNQAGSASATSPAVVPATDPGPAEPCAGRPRVQVAGGAAYVRRPQVSLAVVAPADATGVEVSNDAAFSAPTTVTPSAACSLAWTLAAPPTDATPATVHVRWVGGAAAGQVVTGSVRFDRAGPRVSRATVRFAQRRWVLRVSASDVSGIATVTYAASPTSGLRTVRAAAAIHVPRPESARYVRTTDRLGNTSPWHRTR